jgi:ABC-type bacteriocin/lantibiotic exporter with double-glycine peptidase domain
MLSLILILIIFYGFFDIFIILIPSIIFLSVILKYNNNNIKKWSNQRAELAEKQIGMSYRFVNGIKEVLLSGYIKDIVENFKKLMMRMAIIETKINTVQAVPKGLLEFAAIFIFSLSLIYLNKMGYSSEETIVILSFYLAVAYRIIPSLNKIFVSYQQLKFGKPSYNLLQYYFNLKEENVFNEKINSSIKNIFKKKIILKNIEFDYFRREKFFENEIFEIEKFDKIGIYGESGSGKSTLLNIITFLIKPTKIQLLIDGNKYSDKWKIRDYQNLFSYISQDTFLINDSIKQNILIGSNIDNLDNQKLNEAIKFAKLNNFINKTKNGMETNVGEGLKTISSGQRQRIAIARLYYNQKEILIFDEATNALDEKNEKEIIENIMNLFNKTIILVSHNVNNLKKCNKIYKIENGKIFKKK